MIPKYKQHFLIKKSPLLAIVIIALFIISGCGQRKAPASETISTVVSFSNSTTSSKVSNNINTSTKILDQKKLENHKEFLIDFEGDSVMEKVETYDNNHVVVRKGESERQINYLVVSKQKPDGGWEVIKSDEVTKSGGSVDMNNIYPQVVDLGSDGRQELLVYKTGLKSFNNTYYIFGMQTDGTYGDYRIAKAYLHEKDYLKPGDQHLEFNGLSEGDFSKGITEEYDVNCISRDYGSRPMVDSHYSVSCRNLHIFLPFDSNSLTFGNPQVVTDEVDYPGGFPGSNAFKKYIIDKDYEITVPGWLEHLADKDDYFEYNPEGNNYKIYRFCTDINNCESYSFYDFTIVDFEFLNNQFGSTDSIDITFDNANLSKYYEQWCNLIKKNTDVNILKCEQYDKFLFVSPKNSVIVDNKPSYKSFFIYPINDDKFVMLILSSYDEVNYFDEYVAKSILQSVQLTQ